MQIPLPKWLRTAAAGGAAALLLATTAMAQTTAGPQLIDPAATDPTYATRKAARVMAAAQRQVVLAPATGAPTELVALPGCFEPADTVSSPASGGFTMMAAGDDTSVGPVALGFNFSLFGTTYNSCYINMNGNITFGQAVSVYSPTGFPYATPMIAPFWADVDTRATNSGHVWYKVYPDRLVVLWNKVGFYNTSPTPRKNTFELIIRSNTGSPTVSPDVTFAYGDMQWTTGTASSGTNGFGGTPATVGVSLSANGNSFVQTGRFNVDANTAPTATYPANATTYSGVDWLDGQCLNYTVAPPDNLPPTASNFPANNTLTLYVGQTATVTPQFMAPEGGQTTTVTTNLNGLCNATASNNGATSPIVTLTVTGAACNLGTHTVTFTATDNGTPVASSTFTMNVEVVPSPVNALAFDGTDDYVTIPHNNAFNLTTAISLEAWVRTTSTAEQYITTKTENSWYLAVNGAGTQAGKASFYLNGPSSVGGWLYGTTNIADGHWHHVAGTYDGTTLKIFVDGVLQNSRTAAGLVQTGTSPVLIGARPASKWNGTIDEVRIWSTDRSAQIAADMRAQATVPTTGLVAYYAFDQGTAKGANTAVTSLTDAVAGRNGTLTNFNLTNGNATSNWIESYAMVVPTATAATNAGASGFTANWTAPAVGVVENYLLDLATNATFSPVLNGSPISVAGTSYDVTSLTPGLTYYYRVRAAKASVGDVGAYSATITVPTCPAPAAIAKNVTVALGANGTVTVPGATVNNNSTPTACGTLSYSLQRTGTVSGMVTENGTLTLTAPAGAVFTAVNFASYGNPTSNGNGTYTLGSCNATNSTAIVTSALVGYNSASIVASNGVFGDPCGGTTKSLAVQATYTASLITPAVFTCADLGTAQPVRLTVTDASGNTSSATATVTVIDNLAPVGVTQNATVPLTAAGTATPAVADIDNGSTDNCTLQTRELLGAEEFTNGTFDTDATGWTANNRVDANGGYRSTGGNPGGMFIINGNGANNSDPTLTQTLSGLVVGATYVLRGSYENFYSSGTVGTQAFAVDVAGTQVATFPNPGVVWTPFTLRFTATTANPALAFRAEINGTDIDIAVDNLSLRRLNPSYTCTDLGAQSVALLLTDALGNQSTAEATVTVTVPATPTTTWTGTTTNPLDCSNWSYGKVPDATTNVVIPAGLSTYPTVASGTLSVASISIAGTNGLTVSAGATLQVNGNFSNTGTVSLPGTVAFVGGATQTVTNGVATTFATVTVNKTGGTVQLANDLAVSGALTLTAGTLTTGSSNKVALGATATIAESNTSYVIGAVEATRTLSTPAANNFGGLGLTLTPTGATRPGVTLVRRVTGSPVTGAAGRQGIERYFTITPATNAGLNMAMAFSYFDHELNGIAATNLTMYRGASAATTTWARQTTSTRAGNVMNLTGLTTLAGTFTLGSLTAPLPVELTAFTAKAQDAHTVALAWTTASEKNSDRFEVERSLTGSEFARIATVAAQGTTTAATSYALLDAKLPAGAATLYYRLRQVDADGTAAYSAIQAVTLPAATATLALYPNPAHTAATLLGATPGTKVQVFDALGRVITAATADASGTATLTLPAGLAGGVYVVRSGTASLRLTVE
ncbi:LamG-like jellyroll fold domain-containing protein [Hymenobacter daeguensis]